MTFVKRHDINEFISDNELNSRIYDILLYLQDSCKNGRIPLKRKPLEIFNQAYCLCEILAAEKYPENCIHALWDKTSEQFFKDVTSNKLHSPKINDIIFFNVWKAMAKSKNPIEKDKQYWQESGLINNDFAPGVKMGILKKVFSKIIFFAMKKAIK